MPMKWRLALVLGALALAAVVAAVVWRQRAPTVDVVEPRFTPLTRSLQFSARVATTSRVNVGSTVTGRVAAVQVREGARVRQGDALIQLETDELQTALAQARANEQQARARLAGLRGSSHAVAQAQVAQAAATLQAAERDLARTQQLVTQGFVSAARLDEARKAVQVARAQQDAARAQLQALGDGGADLAQAQAQLAQAQAAQQAAQVRLSQATVRAPTDGRVLVRSVEPGQIVQPGSALLSLALDGPMQLVAQVDERFLDQLQTGQSARVVADAFPNQPFAAQVRSIAPSVDAQRGAIEVKLQPDQAPPDFLREDMTLSVEVRTGQRERALALPVRALRDGASVWVVEGGHVQPRAVTLGLRTLEAVEVTSGLKPGEPVMLQGDAQPGQRVKARAVPWKPGQPGAADRAGDAGAALTNAMGR